MGIEGPYIKNITGKPQKAGQKMKKRSKKMTEKADKKNMQNKKKTYLK